MGKIVVFSAVLYLVLSLQVYCENIEAIQKNSSHIILESPLVGVLDKIMPANAFGLMLQVRRKVRKLLYGVKGDDGKVVGAYEHEGKMCTIKDLAKIEGEYEKDYCAKKKYLNDDRDQYSDREWEQEFISIEKEYYGRMKALREIIAIAKEDFLSMTGSYVGGAREMKKELLGLVQESCDKRGVCDDSFMLKWEEEGHEGESLRNELFSFREFESHCHELCNFMEDMARSCPRTKQRFLDLVRNSRNKFSI